MITYNNRGIYIPTPDGKMRILWNDIESIYPTIYGIDLHCTNGVFRVEDFTIGMKLMYHYYFVLNR
jgi:hypothetical protein